MKAPFSFVPALPAAIGMAAGVIAASWSWASLLLGAALLAFAALYWLNKHYYAYFPLMMAIGIFSAMAFKPSDPNPDLFNRKALFVGEVLSAEETPSTTKCLIRVDSCDHIAVTPIKCMAYVHDLSVLAQRGSVLEFEGIIHPLSPPEARLVPHEVDYEKYLKYQGVAGTAALYNGEVKIVEEPYGFDRLVNNVRDAMYNGIVDSPVNGTTAAFFLTTILGDDVFLNAEMSDNFRAIGISHMLALSGLHVGIIASLLLLLLFPLKITRSGVWVRPICVILLIWCYAVAVGLGASVVRAAVMLSLYLFAQIVQRGSNPFNSLCVAVIVLLILRPYSLFTPGFQLSFAAVFSILLFARLVPDKLKRRPAAYFLANMAVVPVAAMLGTGLVSAYYFNCMPWLFLAANIVAGLVFPWLLGTGMILMLLSIFGISFTGLGHVANFLFGVIEATAKWLSSLGWESQGIFFSAWAILPYAIGILLLAWALRKTIADENDHMAAVLPSKAFLWTGSAVMLVCACVIIAGCREKLPRAEAYIPSGVPTAMILRTGNEAYLVGIDENLDSTQIIKSYNARFRAFLQSRECQGFAFLPDSTAVGPFYCNKGNLIIGDKLIAIINSGSQPMRNTPADYAIVGSGFKSDIPFVVKAARPDTVLISQAVKGQRAKRLAGECADSLACLRLGKGAFSIIIK